MRKDLAYFFAYGIIIMMIVACARKSDMGEWPATDGATIDTLTHDASHLVMVDRGAYISVEIANPWKTGNWLGRYALVPRASELPEGLPADVKVVRIPVERAAVYSSVHTTPMLELEALDALVAVADGDYFAASDSVASMLESGDVCDVGSSMAPSVEKLADADAEIILLSPMEDADISSDVIDRLGIVSIPMADYMETSPLARAEWIKLLGALFGRQRQAQEIWEAVNSDYLKLRTIAASSDSPRPKVLTETEYSGTWYVPAGQSYMAMMLRDAGADYPWAQSEGTGSLPMSVEQVLEMAHDADVWLVKTFGYDLAPDALAAQNKLYANFDALKNGNVYYCNTAERPLFNDIAFHPERVLADYVAIFHPGQMPREYVMNYFKRAD